MKKVINGFDVEVVKANVYTDEVKSKLVFNKDAEEWQVVNRVERAAVTYTINKVITVGAEVYRPTESTGGFLDHAIAKWVAEGKEHNLELSKEILEAIDKEILTDFFNKADSMLPTDLQYYNGEDELTSLHKFVDYPIKLIISDMYYYKDFYFSFMPCTMPEANDKLLSKMVINNESVDFAVEFSEDADGLVSDESSKFYPFLEELLADLDEDSNDNIGMHIEQVAFEHCSAAWEYEGFTDAGFLAHKVKEAGKRLSPVLWQGIINDKLKRNLTAKETASFYGVTEANIFQWQVKLNQA